jgi:hypothetical protein
MGLLKNLEQLVEWELANETEYLTWDQTLSAMVGSWLIALIYEGDHKLAFLCNQ